MTRQKGFTLLEVMVVIAIVAILAAVALPNAVSVRRYVNGQAAEKRMRSVASAIAASNLCAANNQSCPGVAPLIPAPGTMQMGQYTYTFTGSTNWFSYSSYNPSDLYAQAFYIDSTGILRCGFGTANSSSAVCQ